MQHCWGGSLARNVAFCLGTSETEKDLGLMAVRKHVLPAVMRTRE